MKYLSRVKYTRQSMCLGSSPGTYSRWLANSTAKPDSGDYGARQVPDDEVARLDVPVGHAGQHFGTR